MPGKCKLISIDIRVGPASKQNGGSSSRVTIAQYIHMHMYTESVTDMLDTDMHCIYII